MPLKSLDHVLVLATDLEATRDFYAAALGLTVGHRPPFKFAGYWLYLGDRPVVHLAAADRDPALVAYLDERDAISPSGRGPIDHAAFHAENPDEFIGRLDKLGVDYSRAVVPETNQLQLFFRDPNGVRIEVNFDAGQSP